MQIDYRLPSLGADMESATLVQWLKKPGEAVHRGEAIAVVETAKGLIDIECFEDATLASHVVQPGAKVPVGTVLAHLLSDTAVPSPTAPAEPGAAAPAAAAPTAPGVFPRQPTRPGPPGTAARARISPAARRRAHELGVSLESLEHGATGVVHIEDVERLAAQPAAPADARAAMRLAIGSAMARSKREIPHYYLADSLDFSAAREWLARHNAALPVRERLIEGVLIVKAVALAAARCEGFNGYHRDGRFEAATAVNVGTAIAVRGGGLVAPALLNADQKDLAALMREFSDLVSRVRSGHMRSSEFTSATITVTALGEEGAQLLWPIINPPQVAIIGAGRVSPQPWACDGAIVARPVLAVSLAADHRVTDGRAGSRFLRTVCELLADPAKLATAESRT